MDHHRRNFCDRLGLLLVVGLLSAALSVGPATAASPRDKLAGSGNLASGDSAFRFIVSAHSGPSGEDPRGHVYFGWSDGTRGKGEVTCLDVEGNTATAVARLDEPFDPFPGATYSDFALFVTDQDEPRPSSPDDRAEALIMTGSGPIPPPVTTCTAFGGGSPVTQGNFVIRDALP